MVYWHFKSAAPAFSYFRKPPALLSSSKAPSRPLLCFMVYLLLTSLFAHEPHEPCFSYNITHCKYQPGLTNDMNQPLDSRGHFKMEGNMKIHLKPVSTAETSGISLQRSVMGFSIFQDRLLDRKMR